MELPALHLWCKWHKVKNMSLHHLPHAADHSLQSASTFRYIYIMWLVVLNGMSSHCYSKVCLFLDWGCSPGVKWSLRLESKHSSVLEMHWFSESCEIKFAYSVMSCRSKLLCCRACTVCFAQLHVGEVGRSTSGSVTLFQRRVGSSTSCSLFLNSVRKNLIAASALPVYQG